MLARMFATHNFTPVGEAGRLQIQICILGPGILETRAEASLAAYGASLVSIRCVLVCTYCIPPSPTYLLESWG